MIKNINRDGAEIDLTQVVINTPQVKELIKSINRKEQNNENRND